MTSRRALRLAAIFLGGIALGAGLLAASAFLPADTIRHNVASDSYLLRDPLGQRVWLGSDYVYPAGADALRLNIAMISPENPVADTFAGAHYYSGDNPTSLIQRVASDLPPNETYPRYWHGYVPATRLAFTVLTYSQWRTANAIVLGLLALVAMFVAYRRGGLAAGLVVATAVVLAAPPAIVPSMLFSSVIALTLVGIIAAVLLHRRYEVPRFDLELFLLLGAATAYYDQLTAPLLTLGLPLVVLVVCNLHEGRTENWPLVIRAAVAWFGSFAAFWGAKWIIAELMWGSVFADVANQLTLRTGASLTLADRWWSVLANQFMQIPAVLWPADLTTATATLRLGLLGAVVAVVVGASLLWRGVRPGVWRAAGPLVFIAAIPYLWIVALAQHSLEHYYMMFRVLIISTVSLAAFAYYAIDPSGTRGLQARRGARLGLAKGAGRSSQEVDS